MAPSLDSRYDPVSMSACLEDFLQSQAGRPGLQAWRVEGLRALQIAVPGQLEDLPSGECFLFLHTLDLGREARDHSIYIWRGRDAPEERANAAAVLATDLHDFLGGSHAQIREAQGRESAAFQQVFAPEPSAATNGKGRARAADGHAERLFQVMPDGLQEVHRRPMSAGALDTRGCYAMVADGAVHLWRGAAAGSTGPVMDVYAQLEALLGSLNLPPDAPICLARQGGEGPETKQLLNAGDADKATPSRKGRPLPLSASQLSLGPATPSAAHPQRAGAAEGSEETLSPRPAGEVDAEAAAEWEAHVTAKLRAQVAAELQAEAAEGMRAELRESVRAELAEELRSELKPQVAEEVRRELAQQLGGGAPGAALAGAHIAREDAGEAAEQTDKSGLLPRAVRDLDRALEGASPTKIAAVGDELPQALIELTAALNKLRAQRDAGAQAGADAADAPAPSAAPSKGFNSPGPAARGPGGAALIGSPSRVWAPSGDAGRPWLRPKIPPLPIPEIMVPVEALETLIPPPGARRAAASGDESAPEPPAEPAPASVQRRGPRTSGGLFGWRGWRFESAEVPSSADPEPAGPGAGPEQAAGEAGPAEGVPAQGSGPGVPSDPSPNPSPADEWRLARRRRLSQAAPASPAASGENLFFDAEGWRPGFGAGSASRASSMATTEFASAASEPLAGAPDVKPDQAFSGGAAPPGESTAAGTAATPATPDAPSANGRTAAADEPAVQTPLAEGAGPAPPSKGRSLDGPVGRPPTPAPAASGLAAGWGAWRVHPRPARDAAKPQAPPQTPKGSKPRPSMDVSSTTPRQSFWRALMGAPAAPAAGRAPTPPGSVSEAGSAKGSGRGPGTEGSAVRPSSSAAGEPGPNAGAEGGRSPSGSPRQDIPGPGTGGEGDAGMEVRASAPAGDAAEGGAELAPAAADAAVGRAAAPDTLDQAPGAGGRAAPDQAPREQEHAAPEQAPSVDEALDAEGRATQLLGRASAARAKARRLQAMLEDVRAQRGSPAPSDSSKAGAGPSNDEGVGGKPGAAGLSPALSVGGTMRLPGVDPDVAAAEATLEAMLQGSASPPNGGPSPPGLSTPPALQESVAQPSQGTAGSTAALLASASAAAAATAASVRAVVRPVGVGGLAQVPYKRLKAMRTGDVIDCTRKEEYLSDTEFVKVFGMMRNEFVRLPWWRRVQAKQSAGLF